MVTGMARPRSQRSHDAICAATIDLLREVGYAKLTMGEVASRAAVGKDTIYRWWPSKGALVHEAVFQRYPSGSQAAPDTGSLLGDVRALVALVQQALTTPEAVAAIPGLLGEMGRDPLLEERLRVEWYAPMRAGFATVTAQARRRGQRLRRTPPELVADTLVGTLLWRCAFVGLPVDPNLPNQLAALIVGGLDRGDQS
jgi:AcrR family transcriptional regulator